MNRFHTVRGRNYCANAKDKWVKETIKQLNKKRYASRTRSKLQQLKRQD